MLLAACTCTLLGVCFTVFITAVVFLLSFFFSCFFCFVFSSPQLSLTYLWSQRSLLLWFVSLWVSYLCIKYTFSVVRRLQYFSQLPVLFGRHTLEGSAFYCSVSRMRNVRRMVVCVSVNGCVFVCLSMWPCDKLATYPGCHPAFAPRQLGSTPADPHLRPWVLKEAGMENRWMDGWNRFSSWDHFC